MDNLKKMKSQTREDPLFVKRGGERGAALLTMLLVAILLLSAGLALLTSTSLSTTNAIDSTAEMQAYAAAEAGLDAALYVLRGKKTPHASLPAGTKMNFVNAAKPATSNKGDDPQVNISRLSGWLTGPTGLSLYTYQNPSDSTDWRVPLTSSYSPNTGIAYKITIIDPDDPGLIAARKITTVAGYKPTRLLIQSEGYGPKGAIKRLEIVIEHGAFDFEPKQLISAPGQGMVADFGNSDPVKYSGIDHGVPPLGSIPMIAVDSTSVETIQTEIDALDDDQVDPDTADRLTGDNTPPFVRSPDDARAFLNLMRGIASNIPCENPSQCSTGRLFPNQDAADDAGDFGTPTNWKTTFIDNYGGEAVKLGPGHQGSGLLIVTGALETNGTTDFQGVILVLGAGTVLRKGGGDGVIGGAIVIAKFDPNDPNNDTFGAPSFVVDGGGNSKFVYNSVSVRNALEATGFRVMGVREYH